MAKRTTTLDEHKQQLVLWKSRREDAAKQLLDAYPNLDALAVIKLKGDIDQAAKDIRKKEAYIRDLESRARERAAGRTVAK